ncbi:MAG: polysaccharide biosynthesis C-terminal domain-containing protein [Balneolaceae bacterium]|nr:polysaccharide biosynthesis C-terminal domain-containing protein [Balneolaceae bacterium]MCH8549458.1 polysaccharide biosynthesis C-terminal domain-containing protein [Balneolaceae bacterium]
MGIIVRQSVANSLITYVGIGLGFVLTILLYPHILDPDQYGLTRVLVSAALICSQFAHLGFHNLIVRYFPFFRKMAPGGHGFLLWAFLVPAAGFILFAALFFLFDDLLIGLYAERSPLFVDFYIWVLPLTLFLLYFEVLNNYLRSLKDSTSGSLVNEVLQRLVAIGLLVLFFFDLISFALFISLFVISYLLQPVILSLQIARKGAFRLKPDVQFLRKPLLKGMASYSLYSMMGGLATVLVWNIDVIMLGAMAGLDATAVYAIAFYIGSVIIVPQRSIDKIASPLISDFIKNKKWDEVASIYRKSSLNQIIFGLLIFGLIWINLEPLFLLLPEIYREGVWVVFIIGIGKLFDMATGSNGAILLNSKHYRVSFYTNLVLVAVTIGANLLLIPKYGIEGAAIASAFAILVFNSVKTLYIKVKMGMQPFSFRSLLVLLLGTITIWVCYTISLTGIIWIDFPVKSTLFLLIFLLPVLWFRISKDLNQMLLSILKRNKL